MSLHNSEKIADLANQIIRHKEAYYAGNPEISDAEFDNLEQALKKLSPDHPALRMVGNEKIAQNLKVTHKTSMLSLDKTYDPESLQKWIGEQTVMGTAKLDGNSLSLVYQNKALTIGKTRGNGRIGENVTEKIRWIADIPPSLDDGDEIEIRGELYCSETQFLHLAEEMAKKGLDRPTNPRNIVAGTLGRRTHIANMRYFNFCAFDVIFPEGKYPFTTETDKYAWLENAGFNIPEHQLIKSQKQLTGFLERVAALMGEDEIGYDGAVFSYNDLSLWNELGDTSHHPRYKIAFKWQGQTADVVIKEITWATSRLGIVTPVAVIEPVYLSGANISNITLHNAGLVKNDNLKPGDTIEIVRSGEVIPKFLSVKKQGPGVFAWPKTCPSCSTPLSFDDVRLRCPNENDCPSQKTHSILNWIRSVGIDDLSEKRLDQMIEMNLVKNASDLYKLTMDDMLSLPLTKEKMAQKLLTNIARSKKTEMVSFLSGLGIEGTGRTSWEKILESYPTLKNVRTLTAEQIADLDGFAEKSSLQIVEGLAARSELIELLLQAGVKPVAPKKLANEDGNLSGGVFVITGTLSRPRGAIEKEIKAAGGKTTSAVSKNTTAVITGDPDSGSSKMKKAASLGIPVWSEKDLASRLV